MTRFNNVGIADGLDTIADILNLNASKTAFINEYCLDTQSFPDLSEPADWVPSDTWSSQYLLSMVRGNAKALMMPVPETMQDYLESIGLLTNRNNIISPVRNVDITSRTYPFGSIIGRMKIDKVKAEFIEPYDVVSSFVTPDLEYLSASQGKQTLYTSKQSVDFNSKSFLRQTLSGTGIRMAEGIIIDDADTAEEKIRLFAESLKAGGKNTSAWLKFSTAAGGGTKFLPDCTDVETIKQWTADFIANAVTDKDNVPAFNGFADMPKELFRPLVIEENIADDDNLSVIGNYGIQAVVSDNGVTFIGTTKQRTVNGEYEGGDTLTDEEKYIDEFLKEQTFGVFDIYRQNGYRGVMGVDVLACRDNKNNTMCSYVLEANCRFTAATPLLSTVQKLSEITDRKLCGRMTTFPVAVNDDNVEQSITDMMKMFGEELYISGGTKGVVPIMVDSFPGRSDDMSKTRCVLIGENFAQINDLQNRLNVKLGL